MAELGHAIYVDNLTKAIEFATSWGSKYNPSNPLLSIASMTAIRDAGKAAIDATQQSIVPYRNATAAAKVGFDEVKPRVRRIVPAAKACGIPDENLEDVKTYIRKLTGRRLTPKVKDDPNTTDVNEAENSHSASQMSRTQQIENLENVRLLLESYPLYKPNEADLQTDTLKTWTQGLQALIAGVTTNFVPYSNSLGSRDDALYNAENAVVRVGNLFKTYVESAFGRDSEEYGQIRNLKFKKQKRRT